MNLIILRSSPDWLNYDLERSREFIRDMNLPEDLVIEFAALWKRHFRVDYRSVRAQLKALALQTYKKARGAVLLRHEAWDGSADSEGRIAFVDDDDWMSPGLFESLPAKASDEEGVRWGGLRLGRVFAVGGYSVPIIQRRPLDRTVYTNNYAVTPRALHRLGRAAFFVHTSAQRSFDRPDFALSTSEQYLSCAVKHPCCIMSIKYLMSLESFRTDSRREMSSFMEAVDAMRLEDIAEWVREPFARFRAIMADAVEPR